MNVYRIDWEAMIDRVLVDNLAAAAGLAPAPTVAAARPALARILASCGGWPYATAKPTARERRAFALRLLGDAFGQVLGPAPQQAPGITLERARDGMRAITLVIRVEVNLADAAALQTVEGLSVGLAEAIIAERLHGGPFTSMADLGDRVEHVGEVLMRKWAPVIGFMQPSAPRTGALGDPARDLQVLAAEQTFGEPAERLVRVFESVAMRVTTQLHPHTKHELPRSPKIVPPPDAATASRTILLPGKRYYYHVKAAIAEAGERVDVAMFHIAMPGSTHPTRRLLDALAAAHDRGVRVRVLVDRDRAADPYNSTVINAAAVNFLLDAGVKVHVDAARKLLHSKFLVIDADRTIIGSHNWSAGSYFGFDDLSVDVTSTAFARVMRQRFEDLWRRGTAASRDRQI